MVAPFPDPSASPPIVAIVDDDSGVRGSLDSLMRSAGMVGLGFDRAAGLLASGLRARIACVVTDLHMPEMTGLELQSELARQGWTQPVILMTAYPTPAARAQAEAGGAAAFLTKPIDPDALLAAIEAVLA
ncbi:response regulator transcription factor [Novosphingobium aerophilum]|uniref:response regulator transcription factor n=1 Tax=Novosphingobium aerophilum TaxID=2839843 RepID=UPI00180E1B5B